MLLGAPRTGKTRLQSRYILRQFVDIDYEHAYRMGGHKHLRLLDGTQVHLIIHELRAARAGAATDAEDCRRRGLLAQSDAVILTFNPWSRETFEWISDRVVEDILCTGQKKQLVSDIFRILDDLTAAATPQRTKSSRSAVRFGYVPRRLPHRPEEQEDSESELSLVSSGHEDRYENDRIDYRSELKRISIVVGCSVLDEADFMIRGKTLLSPPLQSPTPSPLHVHSPPAMNRRNLATINEANEGAMTVKQLAVLMDRKYFPLMKHDSAISIQSIMSWSSNNSQSALLPVDDDDDRQSAESPASFSEAHPALRPITILSDVIAQEPYEELIRRHRAHTPVGETEIPVLVAATMTDQLRDGGGGALERRVTAEEGQRLARRFGRDCAYIETSAKSNANVDEAYGIIVDQVMAKRAAARRDELAHARLGAAIQAIQAESGGGGRGGNSRPGKSSRARARTCVPSWGWLLTGVPGPSWGAITGALFAGWRRPSGDGGATGSGVQKNVRGEKAVVTRKSQITPVDVVRRSQQSASQLSRTSAAQQLRREGTSVSSGSGLGVRLGARTTSHDAAQDTPTGFINNTMGSGSRQAEVTWPPEPVMPAIPAATYNPLVNKDSERPTEMVTTTDLEKRAMTTETKAQRRRADVLPSLSRKSSKNKRSSSQAPSPEHHDHSELPPVPVPVPPPQKVDKAEQIEAFLSCNAHPTAAPGSRDSFFMILSPTTATRTLSQSVRDTSSVRVTQNSHRCSESTPVLPSPTAMGGDGEKEEKEKKKKGMQPELETPCVVETSSNTMNPRAAPTTPDSAQRPRSNSLSLLSTSPRAAVVESPGSALEHAVVTDTTEVRDNDGDKERCQKESPRHRMPPNPRRPRPRPKGSAGGSRLLPKPPPSPPQHKARARRSNGSRPLSAWI